MWYSVALLFESVHPKSKHDGKDPLFEESIRLIQAEGEQEAKTKAESIGKNGEHAYQTAVGDWLRWRFLKVMDIHEILDENLKVGTEVFSRFHRNPPDWK